MVSNIIGQSVASYSPEPTGSAKSHKIALKNDHDGNGQVLARLKLSHTPIEHRLYELLLEESNSAETRLCAFSIRRLMTLAQLPNYSATRRALQGLINKQSIEVHNIAGDLLPARKATIYLVFKPEEILLHRSSRPGTEFSYFQDSGAANHGLGPAVERVAGNQYLSRREAQVALCCAEGLTNNEIGNRLHISVQTVKYHLRNIFAKYKVKRRAELVSRLMAQQGQF